MNNFEYSTRIKVIQNELGACEREIKGCNFELLLQNFHHARCWNRWKESPGCVFTRDETDLTKWACRCGKTRTVKGTGYSNFLSQLQASHGEALAELVHTDGSTEFSSSSRQSNLCKNLFFANKTVQLHGIIDFVVASLFTFSIVSNSKVKRHLKYDRIDVKTLKKYLELVTEIVERKIAKSRPNQIAVAFDG